MEGKNIKLQYSTPIFSFTTHRNTEKEHKRVSNKKKPKEKIYLCYLRCKAVDQKLTLLHVYAGYTWPNMLICCINVRNNRLLLFSLAVERPICIQFTDYIWWKSSKCPHHYIWFYFHQEHSKAHLHSCHIHTGGFLSLALFFFISIHSSLSLPFSLSSLSSLLFSFSSFSLSLLSSICLSCHSFSRGCRGRADGLPFWRPCCGFAAAVWLW